MPTCPKCRSQYPEGTSSCPTDGEGLLPDEAFSGVDPDLEPGHIVGEYQIENKLGEGGFGTVYKGVHPLIGKMVAVKVLNREFSANPDIVSRFIAEARAVNQIQHHNIIDIFSFGQLEDKRQYYVMEYLDGMPLDAFLERRGRVPVEETISILRPISRALDAAHQKGIAHRDLKPENIFLSFSDDGTPYPKLLDFGIAKLMGEHTSGHRTNTGMPIGTPYYMSPEQCRGRGVDHRTDIYSFGVMVFELITGKRPYQGEDMMDLMLKHMGEQPPSITAYAPDLRAELDGPLLHMMAKDAAQRPATVAHALEGFAQVAQQIGYGTEAVAISGQLPPSTSPAGARAPTPAFTPAAVAQTVAGDAGAVTNSAATLPAQPESKGRAGLIGGIAAVALLAGGAIAFFATRGGPSPDEAAAAATGEAPPAATSAAAPAPPEPPPVEPSVPSEPEPPKTVEITIESTPKVVDVYLGDEKLGTSGEPIELDKGEEQLELVLKAIGYHAKKVKVTPKANSVVAVTLPRRQVAGPKKTPSNKKSEIEF